MVCETGTPPGSGKPALLLPHPAAPAKANRKIWGGNECDGYVTKGWGRGGGQESK